MTFVTGFLGGKQPGFPKRRNAQRASSAGTLTAMKSADEGRVRTAC